MVQIRIGIGYDVHKLTAERLLVLGGVQIPHVKGLAGHSDADVLVHAVMDALLGACGLGDIGHQFPDHDPQYKNISSLFLLQQVVDKVRSRGYDLENLDSIIVAEKPKLAEYIPRMQANLAQTMKVVPERISIKATTTEKLGFEGREEGISVQAVVSLKTV